MACRTGGAGNLGWAGGNESEAIKLVAWKRRVAWGWKRKKTSTLQYTLHGVIQTAQLKTYKWRSSSGSGKFGGQLGQRTSHPACEEAPLGVSEMPCSCLPRGLRDVFLDPGYRW